MNNLRPCAYLDEKQRYYCERMTWENGREDEQFCVFHSKDPNKVDDFERELGEISNYVYFGFIFPEEINFQLRHFRKKADFRRAEFRSKADFISATFHRKVDFSNAKFINDALFISTKFKGEVDFTKAEFDTEADFKDATLECKSNFTETIFGGKADFSWARFKETALFNNTRFKNLNRNSPNLFHTCDLAKPRFILVDIHNTAFFAAQIRKTDFIDPKINSSAQSVIVCLDRVILGRPKTSIGDDNLARSRKYRKIIGITRTEAFERATEVYSDFKANFATAGRLNLHRQLNANEMECRLHGDGTLLEKIFYPFYRFFNGYGLRWFRPLVFLLISIFCFTVFAYQGQQANYQEFQKTDQASGSYEWKTEPSLEFGDSLRHSFEVSRVLGKTYYQIDGLGIEIIEATQKIVSTFFLVLFGQAVRNRLRR